MIYEIRGKQVMLDSDLGKLYHVETKRINEAVKNNPNKFPERFSFILTNQESNGFLVEIFDQKRETRGGRYKNPRVFTEQGVAMLATILKSKQAVEVSINIMDAFVSMRHYLIENKDIYLSINNINNKLIDHDEKFDYIFSNFIHKEKLYLRGNSYDAYSDIIDIFKRTKKELIIIDTYADKTILDLIRSINIKVLLITSKKAKLSQTEIKAYNKKYKNLKIVYTEVFHDRYFIIDKEEIYLCGTSINCIGNKIFTINKLEDKLLKSTLTKEVEKVVN
ncbi:MAG: ORF6N domain-containing protein [Bacilli bacterium]|nr:ORF6N domain-containing protein [Bacilli bacterium]